MSNTIHETYTGTLEKTTCWQCGIPFGVPVHYMNSRREDKRSFYCPNGHAGAFVESEADKLKKRLAQETHRADQARADAQYQRDQRNRAERQASAARGQVTKIKNRVKNGVCPCCNRTFQDLQRHMAKQHPAWTPEAAIDARA